MEVYFCKVSKTAGNSELSIRILHKEIPITGAANPRDGVREPAGGWHGARGQDAPRAPHRLLTPHHQLGTTRRTLATFASQ